MDYLPENEARDLVQEYMQNEGDAVTTQEILDSGAIPRLKGYIIKPGKVSDSIFGGYGCYVDKNTKEKIEFENPPLDIYGAIPLRVMVRTSEISTHDITRGKIPFKDQILASNHNYMRRMLERVIGTSQYEVEGLSDNSVVIAAEDLTQIPFENVLRTHMAISTTTTSLYHHYVVEGKREEFCGHDLPDDLIPNGPLPYLMDTPSTKSDTHDVSISPKELFSLGLCTPEQYKVIINSSIHTYGIVDQFLRERGLMPADTKTEHGINWIGEIVSQDEIWTMDSSRFWLTDDYEEQMRQLDSGEIDELKPKSFSKEFAREFSEGDEDYTDEQRLEISIRYIEGIQHLLGRRFIPDMETIENRIISGLETVVNQLDL